VRLELFPEPLLEVDGEPAELPAAARGEAPSPLVQLGYTDQLRALLEDPGGPATIDLGRRVLEVICAAYRSAGRGGAAETLPFEGDRDLTPHQLWRGG
jgi:hypothetical protein